MGLTRRVKKALRQGEALISAILNGPGPDLNLEGRKTKRFCLNESRLQRDFNFAAGNKNSKNNFITVHQAKSAIIGLYAEYIGFLSAEGDFFGKKPEKTLLPPQYYTVALARTFLMQSSMAFIISSLSGLLTWASAPTDLPF